MNWPWGRSGDGHSEGLYAEQISVRAIHRQRHRIGGWLRWLNPAYGPTCCQRTRVNTSDPMNFWGGPLGGAYSRTQFVLIVLPLTTPYQVA